MGKILSGKAQRQAQQRADIVRDVVPHSAVAARGAADQKPVFIRHGDGHAVDFQLDDPLDRFAGQLLGHPCAELVQLFGAVGVVDRQHRHAMLDLRQLVDRFAADAVGGTVGRDEFRMLRFEPFEFVHQPIVLEVADLGRRQDVVQTVVATDLFA